MGLTRTWRTRFGRCELRCACGPTRLRIAGGAGLSASVPKSLGAGTLVQLAWSQPFQTSLSPTKQNPVIGVRGRRSSRVERHRGVNVFARRLEAQFAAALERAAGDIRPPVGLNEDAGTWLHAHPEPARQKTEVSRPAWRHAVRTVFLTRVHPERYPLAPVRIADCLHGTHRDEYGGPDGHVQPDFAVVLPDPRATRAGSKRFNGCHWARRSMPLIATLRIGTAISLS